MAGVLTDAVAVVRDTVFDVFAADTLVQLSVTYTAKSNTTYSAATDANTSSVVTDTVTVIKTPVSNEEVEQNESVMFGDRKYLGRLSDFTNLAPDNFKESDEITDGSETWKVVMFKTEPTQQLVIFFARRVVS